MPSVISLTDAFFDSRSWKAHLEADDLAQRRLQLLGDALGHAAGGNTARLGVADQAATVDPPTPHRQRDLRAAGSSCRNRSRRRR
jgi:hypothetical protein